MLLKLLDIFVFFACYAFVAGCIYEGIKDNSVPIFGLAIVVLLPALYIDCILRRTPGHMSSSKNNNHLITNLVKLFLVSQGVIIIALFINLVDVELADHSHLDTLKIKTKALLNGIDTKYIPKLSTQAKPASFPSVHTNNQQLDPNSILKLYRNSNQINKASQEWIKRGIGMDLTGGYGIHIHYT